MRKPSVASVVVLLFSYSASVIAIHEVGVPVARVRQPSLSPEAVLPCCTTSASSSPTPVYGEA